MAQPLGTDDEEKRAVPTRDGDSTLVHVGNATNGAVYSVALASNEWVFAIAVCTCVACLLVCY